MREQERLPPRVLDRLANSTESILRKLENPARHGPWDRRGMVVGQIQSGKTANYTGLICRAADAGYRLIVVLAGIHNNLRSQTQLRLDAGFLGIDTQRRQLADTDAAFAAAALGVGRLLGAPRLDAASLTSSAENGDFGVQSASRAGHHHRRVPRPLGRQEAPGHPRQPASVGLRHTGPEIHALCGTSPFS